MSISGVNVPQFARFVVRPTLQSLGLDSLAARRLVVGTMLAESLGSFLDQIVGPDDTTLGPAVGLYQIEMATYNDLYKNFLSNQKRLAVYFALQKLLAAVPEPPYQLVTNLSYATAICRLIYYRRPEPLPDAHNLFSIASYWKKFYNTPVGAGTVNGFMEKAAEVMQLSMED